MIFARIQMFTRYSAITITPVQPSSSAPLRVPGSSSRTRMPASRIAAANAPERKLPSVSMPNAGMSTSTIVSTRGGGSPGTSKNG